VNPRFPVATFRDDGYIHTMIPVWTLLCTLTLGGGHPIESICEKVAPGPPNGMWARSNNQTTAVVVIHGFYLHLKDKSVSKAALRPWQQPDSPLIKELGKSADVYVFAYGQNATIDGVVAGSKLGEDIAHLRRLGYKEVILVGHSAGGLIARHFVEDHPDAG